LVGGNAKVTRLKAPCVVCGEPATCWSEFLGYRHVACTPERWFELHGWKSAMTSRLALIAAGEK